MHIIADENIPFVEQAFTPLGTVSKKPGRQLKQQDLLDCECLLVRSVTPVNKSLLQETPVKFVASATIGTDHIDLDYLAANNIGFANAPGCNAESASEYMINALFALAEKKGFDPFSLKAGIIGYGNVGSRVKQKLDILGIPSLVNDPPLQQAGDKREDYVSIETILEQCNFITLHVPLTRHGDYPTRHLFNEGNLNQLFPGCILFNAARGPVIDNPALSRLLNQRNDLTVYLDCWENEPAIDQTLLKQVDLATPHIAGYSYEGKLRGTQMILDAACEFFQSRSDWNMIEHLPQPIELQVKNGENRSFWKHLFQMHYPVFQDHNDLKAILSLTKNDRAKAFDLLRKNYPKRYEYNQYRISGIADKKIAAQIERLSFQI